MTSFALDLRRFERQPQSEHLSTIFTLSMELNFEPLKTDDIDMNPSHSVIDHIVNRNFGNTFCHQNGTNKCQHTNKNNTHKYNHITTRQQHQQRNTGQNIQHRNPSQTYQTISFQINITSSIPYLRANCLGCGLNNRVLR